VSVARSNTAPIGATPVWETTVAYSFCIKPWVASCLNGYGKVPNSAFKGSVTGNYLNPDVLTLNVDTSKIPGFLNQICYVPDENGVANRPMMHRGREPLGTLVRTGHEVPFYKSFHSIVRLTVAIE